MKKILTLLLAAAVAAGCSNTMKITGTDEAFADGKYAYLKKIDDSLKFVTLDSALIADNTFTLRHKVESPDYVTVEIAEPEAQMPDVSLNIYMENGNIEIKKIKPEYESFSAVGTPLNDAHTAFDTQMWDLSNSLRAAYDADDAPKANEANAKMAELLRSTIAANKDNLIGPNLFIRNCFEFKPQEILDIVATFGTTALPSGRQVLLNNIIELAQGAMRVAAGNPYINVAADDADGKELSLESVVNTEGNKYVLLDFWASWCVPCMAEVPYMKATYDKYRKKGFEIYGISLDRDREAWLKAVNDKKMNWVHVSPLDSKDNRAAADYAIKSIPSNFLIDCATGTIVATGLRGEALQAKIGELLD